MQPSADFADLADRVRNWGRWGPDDERGTLNLITDAHRVAASRLVRTGEIFDLGLPLDANGPQRGGLRTNPIRLMAATDGTPTNPPWFKFADDYVMMPLQAGTQWDALGHVWYDDALYNGYPSQTVTARGLERNSIDRLAPGIVGRGVLIDIARHRGIEHLGDADTITGSELDIAARSQGVAVTTGDILLIRTGWTNVLSSGDRNRYMDGEPGLTTDAVEWIAEHDVAALACDNWGIGAKPGRTATEFYEVHMLLLRDMGMPLGEHFNLEKLATACASDSSYEFMFCSEILKFTDAAGTPTNPIAIR